MAVLIEALSVIIRLETIENKYPGGGDKYLKDAPNSTFCSDDKIGRLGFMSPVDVESFIKELEIFGFEYLVDGKASDIAVIDQIKGFMMPCDWLIVGHVEINDGKDKVMACKLKGCNSNCLMLPDGWDYNNSLSKSYTFVPSEHLDKSLKYLRHENGVDVYLNLLTGKEAYSGRTQNILKKSNKT